MTMASIPRWLVYLVSAVLALALLALFFGLAYYVADTANMPPRLADPAPTTPPTPNSDGELPPQARAAYDPNTRLLGVLAIVSPLLTTVIGFYFGQRAGEATGEAAKSKAEMKQAEIATALFDSGDTGAVQVLRDQGLIARTPAQPEADVPPEPAPNAQGDRGGPQLDAGGQDEGGQGRGPQSMT